MNDVKGKCEEYYRAGNNVLGVRKLVSGGKAGKMEHARLRWYWIFF